jgi:hypothetical protein
MVHNKNKNPYNLNKENAECMSKLQMQINL